MERKVDPSSVETAVYTGASDSALGAPRQGPNSIAEEGRFVPGTLLGGRYRIIGLLGRRRYGRSLSRNRSDARPVCRPEVPARGSRDEPTSARTLSWRSRASPARFRTRTSAAFTISAKSKACPSSPWSMWTAKTLRRCSTASDVCRRTRRSRRLARFARDWRQRTIAA